MVEKYVFGSPFETEAVLEELAAAAYAGQELVSGVSLEISIVTVYAQTDSDTILCNECVNSNRIGACRKRNTSCSPRRTGTPRLCPPSPMNSSGRWRTF